MSAHCCCIDSGSCLIDSKMVESLGRKQAKFSGILTFQGCQWRDDVLKELCDRNKKESNKDYQAMASDTVRSFSPSFNLIVDYN